MVLVFLAGAEVRSGLSRGTEQGRLYRACDADELSQGIAVSVADPEIAAGIDGRPEGAVQRRVLSKAGGGGKSLKVGAIEFAESVDAVVCGPDVARAIDSDAHRSFDTAGHDCLAEDTSGRGELDDGRGVV